MSNPTSNFNWQMPTASDLVTDLPADFETFGQAVDTSLADLKGGTTGQVLSKASNTDMDFTWVAQDDSNAIQNAIVDAKGDLIAASAADTPARLAVGANGETLVADSSTSTGLRYQSAYNGNAIINGGFDIWQRGTSFTSTAANPSYTADRWNAYNGRTGTTYSRQSSGLTGFQYSMRVQRDSGNTATGGLYATTTLETADSLRFAGQTVTMSFYAKIGANYSGSGNSISVQLLSGTGTDQSVWSFTGSTVYASSTPTLSTSWQRFTVTGTVSSSATELALLFVYAPTGTAGANDWFEITGVQFELGSVATTFKRAGGTIQGELAACQRYYFKIGAEGNAYTAFGNAASTGANGTDLITVFPVSMRTQPTAVESTAASTFSAGSVTGLTAITYNSATNSKAAYTLFQKTGGFTALGAYPISANNSTAAYLAWSAEL